MRQLRGWIALAAIALIIGGAAYLLQPRSGSPEHSSNSDAADGASGALLFAQAMGHPADQITGNFNLPAKDTGVMLVFTPSAKGSRTGSFDVTDHPDTSSPHSVPLAGRGT